MKIHDATLVLASASPRRRALLEGAGIHCIVRPVDIDETPYPSENPKDFVTRMALSKAKALNFTEDDPSFALASDTVVTLDGAILGKPHTPERAVAMLRQLSGRTHVVLTAYALRGPDGIESGYTATDVTFRALSDEEIAAYVASGEPLDKAGAYAIQGGARLFVESLHGSYDGVVGLPIAQVCELLVKSGVCKDFPFGVQRRLDVVRSRIREAALAANRNPNEITLVAVSKRQPLEALRSALAAGQVNFGENYVQEWREKAFALGPGVLWHFIGSLQKNKVKFIDPRIALVHSVDSLELGQALARHARSLGYAQSILVEVNLGKEASKGGVSEEDAKALVRALQREEGLDVRGLMILPPPDVAHVRPFFKQLRELRDELATTDAPLPELSMGTSADYEIAIAEGATLVRVGTSIFGPRAY